MFTVLVVLGLAACGTEASSTGHDPSTPPPVEATAGPEAPPAPPAAAGVGAPIRIEPGAFAKVEDEQGDESGHARYSSPPGGACMVAVDWWRPMPPDPGGPMVTASERPVTVAGVETTVITTSAFQGTEREVDVVFLRGDRYQVRIVFEECGAAEEDAFLAGVQAV